MQAWFNLCGEIKLTGTVNKKFDLKNPEEMSIFFDGLRIKTSKGNFDLYEDNNCDFEYDFTPIDNGYLIDFKVKGANWYKMEEVFETKEEIDWEEDKLDLLFDDIFTQEEIEREEVSLPILEMALDVVDDDDKSYCWETGYNLTIPRIWVEEWQSQKDVFREIEINNSDPEATMDL